MKGDIFAVHMLRAWLLSFRKVVPGAGWSLSSSTLATYSLFSFRVVTTMLLLRIHGSGALRLTGDLTKVPPYAILSHTWGPDEDEVTHDDFVSEMYHHKAGYAKIQLWGTQTQRDNLEYFWVDSYCIDKKNYTELSEAITSTFRWYPMQ